MCSRSSYPFYKVTYYIKWVVTIRTLVLAGARAGELLTGESKQDIPSSVFISSGQNPDPVLFHEVLILSVTTDMLYILYIYKYIYFLISS